jgi:hypothetical protein
LAPLCGDGRLVAGPGEVAPVCMHQHETALKPPGLSFSTTGVWSGKPTAKGTYSFTVQVTDKTGKKVTKALKIVIT